MRIQGHIANQSKTMDAVTTSNGALSVSDTKIQKASAIDISSIVMDDEASKGQGKTAKDVMQEAGEKNISLIQDYMIVMSNFMSDEDYAQLIKEGKKPGSMNATEMVTSLDKIKVTLAQAGVEIKGFTDTLDRETLEKMLGRSMTAAIGELLSEKDIPPTDINIEEVTEAFKKGTSLTEITDETKKYIIKNEKELTIDNLYKSQFSASTNPGKKSKGYYREELSGYLSKTSETLNWEGIETQVKEIVQSAGYEGTKNQLKDAKWIIEQGIPLTKEAFSKLQKMNSLKIPVNSAELLDQITNAIANQKNAKFTLLTGEKNILKEAIRIKEDVEAIPNEAVNLLPLHSKISLGALIQIIKEKDVQEQATENITAMRQMEEIRFSMSIEANYRLLKSGFAIETEPLEKVIEQLKNIENEALQNASFQNKSTVGKQENIYIETLVKKNIILTLPIDMIGRIAKNEEQGTINEVYKEGLFLQKQYQIANQKYEPLATEVRTDLGDSIQKAFRTAEALIEELGFENTQANQKAVRILGYNQMELSEKNMYKVKETNLAVTRCIEKMTPSKILQLIKDGINPLETEFSELEGSLDKYEEINNGKWDQYARFLQHMESKKEVSKEEKEAYIGIHRLLRQIEKTDGAVIGSLINQGAEISLKNLLSAVRTRNHKQIDYKVNEDFDGVEATRTDKSTITEQIENYYNKLLVKMSDQMEKKAPTTLNISMDLTLEEFADTIDEFPSMFNKSEETIASEANEMRKTIQMTDDAIYKNLLGYEQPVTADNMSALSALMNQRGSMYQKLFKVEKELEEKITNLNEVMNGITNSFSDQEETTQAFERLKKVMKEVTEKAMDIPETGKIDQRAISLLYKQVALTTNLAKEENYEVPVFIGDELTSINLRILHQTKEKGKVVITTNTEEFGKLMAEFSVNEKEIKGYMMIEKEASKEAFIKKAKRMELVLSEDGTLKVEIDVILNNAVQINGSGNTKLDYKKEKAIATKKLYGLAKIFLQVIQEK